MTPQSVVRCRPLGRLRPDGLSHFGHAVGSGSGTDACWLTDISNNFRLWIGSLYKDTALLHSTTHKNQRQGILLNRLFLLPSSLLLLSFFDFTTI